MSKGIYSKSMGDSIITAEEVKEILDIYNIGKKPLAKLLGWGETTIIRYIEGDIPTCEYSQKLMQLKEDPHYYYDLLLENQDKLTTVAFKKSKKAVLNIMMQSKIKMIAQYIINRANGEITPRMVQYILFYSQALSLGIWGKELFEDECKSNYNSMPFLSLYESMKRNGIKVFDISMDCLSRKELDIVDSVIDAFDWFGPKCIRTLFSMERLDYALAPFLKENKMLPNEAIKEAYQFIFKKYNIEHIKDFNYYIHKRMKEIFTKNDAIKRVNSY